MKLQLLNRSRPFDGAFSAAQPPQVSDPGQMLNLIKEW
jgi:hypothetical protein